MEVADRVSRLPDASLARRPKVYPVPFFSRGVSLGEGAPGPTVKKSAPPDGTHWRSLTTRLFSQSTLFHEEVGA